MRGMLSSSGVFDGATLSKSGRFVYSFGRKEKPALKAPVSFL